MKESESSSYSNSEDLKIEINLKISDIEKNKDKTSYYSAFGSGASEEEKIKNSKEEKISIIRRPSIIERNLIESVNKRENVTKENLELAEKINFKNNIDKLIETDEFGFYTNQTEKYDGENQKLDEKNIPPPTILTKEELLKINARTEKWNKMLTDFKKYKTLKKSKLKSRTRKGIPDSLRSQAWQLLANTNKLITNKNLFKDLDKEEIDKETEITIMKDLDRTFPMCQLFKDKYGSGQRKLFHVLMNYSKYNKKLGYVQGMGYLAAIFLIYMDEESSFYMLHCLMKKYKLEGLYYDNFPDLKKKCYVFLNLQKKYINKIYTIMQRDGIVPTMYLSSWFISLFARTVEFHIALRIYDCFFLEGFKVIYRIALGLLKLSENSFCDAKKGETIPLLYKVQENIDVEELFKVSFGFHISRNFIDKCEEEYEKVKDDTENEFMKQLAW